MVRTLLEILANSPYSNLGTVKEGLESYKHIHLTDDEVNEAILAMKMRKESLLKEQEIRKIEAENRKNLFSGAWRYGVTKQFMQNRAQVLFKKQFILDEYNTKTFELLCLYFSNDPQFVIEAMSPINQNPSLDKGILLYSPFGYGKTWMMQLFARNARQVYKMFSAKKIANDYENYKEAGISDYLEPFKNAINDADSFYQRYSGICIDDFGAEGIKQNFGNKRNVLSDVIEHRYATHKLDEKQPELNKIGAMFHVTTNLNATEIHNMYGGRVASRMREMFNTIELPGSDRRK